MRFFRLFVLFLLPPSNPKTFQSACSLIHSQNNRKLMFVNFIFFLYIIFFQEHPSLKGTPLAMLAAQCNKLSSKSPPPLADAAVGKGFHPWKKSPQSSSGPQSPTNVSPQNNNNNNNNNQSGNNLSTQRSISGSPMNNSTITPTR